VDEPRAEAGNLDEGYLPAARVLSDRREQQLAWWRIGPLDELRSVANQVPGGTRVQTRPIPEVLRAARRQGAETSGRVRGLVTTRQAAPGRKRRP